MHPPPFEQRQQGQARANQASPFQPANDLQNAPAIPPSLQLQTMTLEQQRRQEEVRQRRLVIEEQRRRERQQRHQQQSQHYLVQTQPVQQQAQSAQLLQETQQRQQLRHRLQQIAQAHLDNMSRIRNGIPPHDHTASGIRLGLARFSDADTVMRTTYLARTPQFAHMILEYYQIRIQQCHAHTTGQAISDTDAISRATQIASDTRYAQGLWEYLQNFLMARMHDDFQLGLAHLQASRSQPAHVQPAPQLHIPQAQSPQAAQNNNGNDQTDISIHGNLTADQHNQAAASNPQEATQLNNGNAQEDNIHENPVANSFSSNNVQLIQTHQNAQASGSNDNGDIGELPDSPPDTNPLPGYVSVQPNPSLVGQQSIGDFHTSNEGNQADELLDGRDMLSGAEYNAQNTGNADTFFSEFINPDALDDGPENPENAEIS